MDVIGKCRATCDYEKKDANELTLKTGDVVDILIKGKLIWYGRLHDDKGFFPSRVVQELNEQADDDTIGLSLSTTAVVDNEKNKYTVDSSEPKKVTAVKKQMEEPFENIAPTPPLEDKRRLRAKSTGRPPSQVFIKENILQRDESMENLSAVSDDEENERQRKVTPAVSTNITSVSQLVLELKQKPLLKTMIQKDATSETAVTETSTEVPSWMKALTKKKSSISGLIKKTENPNVIPPWMQEVRKKKEHKLSLSGDDETHKLIERRTKHSGVEMQSCLKTRTVSESKVVSEEKGNVQTKSISLETREISANNNNFTFTKVSQSYTSSGNSSEQKVTTALENVQSNISKTPEQSTSILNATKIARSVAKQENNSIKSVSYIETNLTSAEKLHTTEEVKDNKPLVTESPKEKKIFVSSVLHTNVEKVGDKPMISETQKTIILSQNLKSDNREAKLEIVKLPKEVDANITSSVKHTINDLACTEDTENKLLATHIPQNTNPAATSTEKIEPLMKILSANVLSTSKQEDGCEKPKNVEVKKVILADQQSLPNLSSEISTNNKMRIAANLQLVLKEIETFDTKYKDNSVKIREDIQKLEKALDQQYEDIKVFIEATKEKLFDLLETKEH